MIPGLGRSPGEGNGNSLLYSCLANLMDIGAWWALVHGITKEQDVTQQLNNNNKNFIPSDRSVQTVFLIEFLWAFYF